LVAAEELLLQDLDGNILLLANELAQVDFAGVTLTERLEDLELVVENGVLFLSGHFSGGF